MRARSHCGVGSGARLKALNDINIGGGLSPPLPLVPLTIHQTHVSQMKVNIKIHVQQITD